MGGRLYTTPSKMAIDPLTQPQAGVVFRARPGVTGQPAASYRGITSPA